MRGTAARFGAGAAAGAEGVTGEAGEARAAGAAGEASAGPHGASAHAAAARAEAAWRVARAQGRRRSALARIDATAKRIVDIAFSSVGLLLSLPVSLLLVLAIWIEDSGPAFFVQERVGRGGRRFRMRKFRTMGPWREETASVADALQGRDTKGLPGVLLQPRRVTRVGKLLRPTALDELPQLWNILVGDMSLVGPRALVPAEAEPGADGQPFTLNDRLDYLERHSVRPGLTGLAQVRLRRSAPRREKYRVDLLYVRRRTLWLDLALLARSVWISLRGAWPSVGADTGRGLPPIASEE